MELVKVISLKRILTAVLIIVLNIALFCIINNGQYSYKIYDNMLKEYNGELNEGNISDYHGYIRQYESDNPDITDKKYVLMNAPKDKLEEIIAVLPGMKSPTVMPLAQEGWCSVHTVLDEKRFWEIIGKLKALGAEGILVLPIEKMIV